MTIHVNFELYRACMKNSTTRVALQVPINKPTTMCQMPGKGMKETLTVRTVRMISTLQMPVYVIGETMRSAMVASRKRSPSFDSKMEILGRMRTEQVKQRQQENPHTIDKVPVQAG